MSGFTHIKTFDRYTDDAAPQAGAPAASGVWALRITRFDVGAKIGFAEDNLRTLQLLSHYRRRPAAGVEPFEVYISGNVAFEYVTTAADFDIFDGSFSAGTGGGGGGNTAVNELDSGPVAVAAGANATQIIAANSARVRGVTVQNVGTTTIAIGKTAALKQNLTAAIAILPPGAAANDGTGGSVTVDGWQGPVFAVNVAAGPGSVLVSAF